MSSDLQLNWQTTAQVQKERLLSSILLPRTRRAPDRRGDAADVPWSTGCRRSLLALGLSACAYPCPDQELGEWMTEFHFTH